MAEIIYIGIKLVRISKQDSSRLEISDNAGITWSAIAGGYIGEFFHLGKRDSTIYAKTSEGNFQSVTLGRTWTKK